MSDLILQDAGEAIKGLPQRHRYGILQLRTSHLDNLRELLSFLTERGDQFLQMGKQLKMLKIHTDMDSGRICVVRGLRAVHMVVR